MAQINRANLATNLNLGGAWTGGVAPTSIDIAAWGTPNITVGTAQALGGAVSWQGILLQSVQTTAITIGTTSAAMTIGASGIDLSASGANLTIASPVAITLGANQSWTVASGRTLTVSSVISGAAKNVTFDGTGAKTLSANSAAGWTGSAVTAAAGLVTTVVAGSLGASTNTVTVNNGAAVRVTGNQPNQTAWSASGSGLAGTSYGAIWTDAAFGSGRTITAKADGTVISIRSGVGFLSLFALDAGVTAITLNGDSTATSDIGNYTVSGQSNYAGTPTLSSLALDGTTARGIKYSIGGGAGVTDSRTSGGGGLGADANAVVVAASGGIYTNSASGSFNRNYTFTARARQTYGHFRYGATGTATFSGTLTLSGTASDYVQFHANNNVSSIIKLAGTITGGANLDIGQYSGGPTTIGTAELAPTLVTSGWSSTASLTVNNIRYGVGLANENAISFVPGTTIDNVSGGALTVRHSSYTNQGVSTFTFTGTNDLTMAGPVAGSASWAGTPGAWSITASTLTLDFSFNGTSGTLTKQGSGTLALLGNNTAVTALSWAAGGLTLNSNGAAGPTGTSFTITSTGVLDSTTGATLTQTGTNALNNNFTWGGSNDLTFGAGAITWLASRSINFLNGKTGTLKFTGNIGSIGATFPLSIGGTPIGGSRSRLWLSGTNGMLATSNAVNAGYFRVSNSSGLGNAATTMWTVSSGAALEVDGGISPPSARSVTITGPGPNIDGALRSVSGTNVWNGSIVLAVQSLASPTRIQVDAGTFTLATGSYATIAPTTSGTPLQFTALGASAILNQPRQLTANVSDVTVNNGGVGTVVFSVANSHTGSMTCEGGTTKITDVNATSTGTVQVNATATLESTVQSQFGTLSLGSSPTTRAILKFAA